MQTTKVNKIYSSMEKAYEPSVGFDKPIPINAKGRSKFNFVTRQFEDKPVFDNYITSTMTHAGEKRLGYYN